MRKTLIFSLVLMGFTSLCVQGLLIREFLISFYGNELTIGIILANWILLETLGSSLTSRLTSKVRHPFLFYALLQLGICLYLPAGIWLVRIVKNLWGVSPGEGLGLGAIFLSSLLIMAVLSFFDGAQFPLGCRLWGDLTQKKLEAIGRVYIFEAIGFIIAGPLFTYVFITRMSSMDIGFAIALLNIFCAILLVRFESKPLARTFARTLLICVCTLFLIGSFSGLSRWLERQSIKAQWQKQRVVDYRNSLYGNITVTQNQEQYTFFNDGIPLLTSPTPNIIYLEEFVHFSLLAHPWPHDILFVGPAAGGFITEALKHPGVCITYTELDPLLIQMVRRHPTRLTEAELTDPRVEIQLTDGARFIKTTAKRFDIILINLPPPSSLNLNRFYTQEFIRAAKSTLRPDGILVFNLPGSLDYLEENLRRLNLSLAETLRQEFTAVEVLPGDTNLFLASSSRLNISPDIFLARLEKRRIQTKLLTEFYLRYRLDPGWKLWFWKTVSTSEPVRVNHDYFPSSLLYELAHWNALFSPGLKSLFSRLEQLKPGYLALVMLGILELCIAVSFLITRKRKMSITIATLTTGFFGITFELVCIMSSQANFGFVYQQIALLVTAFMAGLTLGGWLVTRHLNHAKNDRSLFLALETGMVVFGLLVPLILVGLNRHYHPSSYLLYYFLSSLSGLLVGAEFPLANKLYLDADQTGTGAGLLYAMDLGGAWVGSLLVSVFMLPVLGLVNTCLFLVILKATSCLLVNRFV